MGSTLLQALPRFTDGLYLFESFESSTFTADQAWTLAYGSPTRTQSVSKEGLWSLNLSATPCGLSKLVSHGAASCWFYDDASNVTSDVQSGLLSRAAGYAFFGAYASNIMSTGFYAMQLGGAPAITTVPRSTGWHRFSVVSLGGVITVYIDNVSVGSAAGGTLVEVNIGSFGGSTDPFGFLDDVQVTPAQMFVSGVTNGDTVTVVDANNSLLATGVAFGPSLHLDLWPIDSPFQGRIVVTRPGGGLRFISDLLALSNGDGYHYVEVDMGRRPSSLDAKDNVLRNDTESNSGLNQSITFNGRERVSMGFRDLTDAKKDELTAWWSAAKAGATVAVTLDSDNRFYSLLTANVGQGAQTLTVQSATGLAKGTVLLVRTQDGIESQLLTVESVAGAVVNVTPPIAFPFKTGDLVRAKFYWPFLITTDKALPLTLSQLKDKRWTLTLGFKEKL